MKRFLPLILLLACCGCIDPQIHASTADVPNAPSAIDELIQKLDSDTFQPCLPDCLKAGAAAPRVEQEVRQGILVYYYPAPFECPACRVHERDAPGMRDFVFVKAKPDAWVGRQQAGYPHFRWQVNGKWRGEAHGWSTPDDFRRLYAKSFELPVAGEGSTFAPSYANAPATGLYYRSQASWSWPGSLRHHLTQPPHNLSPARVARMSDAECMAVHDAWHNKYGMKSQRMESRHEVRMERAQRPGVFGLYWGRRACPSGGC